LCELLSRAYLAPRVRGRAEITRADAARGRRRRADRAVRRGLRRRRRSAAAGQFDQAASRARVLGGSCFPAPSISKCSVHPRGQAQQEALVAATADLAAELGLPLVATHPIQFLERDDFKAHEARVCIAEGLHARRRPAPRLYTEEQYFKSPDEMVELFADLPEALENSVEIAKRCNLRSRWARTTCPISRRRRA
jgi:DNA polymerase-3 subunit alpha